MRTLPWITASDWLEADNQLLVKADLSALLDQHGNGVYTIVVWADVEGERSPVSEYSIFIPHLDEHQLDITPTP